MKSKQEAIEEMDGIINTINNLLLKSNKSFGMLNGKIVMVDQETKATCEIIKIPKQKCSACAGSGWYDACDKKCRPIKCGACNGTGES